GGAPRRPRARARRPSGRLAKRRRMPTASTATDSDSKPWYDTTAAHIVEGAVAGTLAAPILGPLATVAGGVIGAIDPGSVFPRLFGDDPKPAEAKKGVAKKAEEAKVAAQPAVAAPPIAAPETAPGQKKLDGETAAGKIDAGYAKVPKAPANQSLAGLDSMSKEKRLERL